MQCSNIQNLFSEYADNELNPVSADQVRTHLASCDSCSHEWAAFERTVHFLHGMSHAEAPSDLIRGIHAKLDKPSMLQKWWDWLQNIDLSMSIPAATATVAVALVTAVLLKSYYLEPKNQNQILHQQTIVAQNEGEIKNPAYKRILPSNRFAGNSPQMIPAHSSRSNNFVNTLPTSLFPSQTLNGLSKRNDISPDITVTVQPAGKKNIAALHHILMNVKGWQVIPYGNDQILILLKPNSLSMLHKVLAHNKLHISNHDATFSSRIHAKNLIKVAVRFQ